MRQLGPLRRRDLAGFKVAVVVQKADGRGRVLAVIEQCIGQLHQEFAVFFRDTFPHAQTQQF